MTPAYNHNTTWLLGSSEVQRYCVNEWSQLAAMILNKINSYPSVMCSLSLISPPWIYTSQQIIAHAVRERSWGGYCSRGGGGSCLCLHLSSGREKIESHMQFDTLLPRSAEMIDILLLGFSFYHIPMDLIVLEIPR